MSSYASNEVSDPENDGHHPPSVRYYPEASSHNRVTRKDEVSIEDTLKKAENPHPENALVHSLAAESLIVSVDVNFREGC